MSTTTALSKKSLKARFVNNKNDLAKLREELRQRCKLRMRQKREELINQRRFGVSSIDLNVDDKLKEIFSSEWNDLLLTENYDVSEGTTNLVKKYIDDRAPVEPVTDDVKLILEEIQELKQYGTTVLSQDVAEEEPV